MGVQPALRLAAVLTLGAVAASAAFLGGRYSQNLPHELAATSAGVDLTRDATELNKTLPEMVSQGVRLDRTSAGPGKMFNYYYTILDDDQARALAGHPGRHRQVIAQLSERVCAMMPNYVQNGVVVTYHMNTRIGVVLPAIIVDPGACGASPAGR